MDQPSLSQIEESFRRLPISEQLGLIERLVHRVHESTLRRNEDLDSQLAAMAADPEIQAENRAIEQEFTVTENDGLQGL